MTEGVKVAAGARKRRVGVWLRPELSSGKEFHKLVSEMTALMPEVARAECARLLQHLGRPQAARRRRAA